jgi:hypothetical protein
MNANEQAVAAIYEAFGQGNVSGILEHLSQDVAREAWADNRAQKGGVPWMAPRHGKTGAAEFFRIIGGFRISELKVLSVMSGANQVAVEVAIRAEVPATGGAYADEEMHL